MSCVVSGSAAEPGIDLVCTDVPGSAASTPGRMVDVGGTCHPVCMDGRTDPDDSGMTDGWGCENEASCVVSGGVADTGMPCA